MQRNPILDIRLAVPEQLKAIRQALEASYLELAAQTGLSRLTVAAAEGKSDARLSSVVALFNALGYELIPVPKPMLKEVAAFVNNGGKVSALPSGVEAPLSLSQQAFQESFDNEPARAKRKGRA